MRSELKNQNMGASAAPSRLVVGGYGPSSFAQAVKLLQGLVPISAAERGGVSNAFSDRLVIPRETAKVDVLTEAYRYDDRSALVLFVENLEAFLAKSISQSRPLAESAREWQAAADRLLALAEKNREKVFFYTADEVIVTPNDFAESLSRCIGIDLVYSGGQLDTQKYCWDDFHLLVAHQYVRENNELTALASAVRARRDFVPQTSPTMQVDWSSVLGDVGALREENRVLFEQLHKLQLEYEHNYLQLKRHEETNRDFVRKLADAERQARDAIGMKDDLQRKLDQKQAEMDKIRRSISWRLTLPFRVVKRFLRRLSGR